MLAPFHNQINDLVFVYAHIGRLEDEGNRVYSISSTIVRPSKSPLEFESLVRYDKFTERERYYSNLSKKELEPASNFQEIRNRIKTFLQGQKFAFTFNDKSNLDELKKFVGIKRIVDLSFASEFFLQHLESHSLKRLWEYLFKKRRDRVSFSASEIVLLSIEVVKHICGAELNDQKYSRARTLRYYLKKSDTLFGEAFVHTTKTYRKYFGGLFDPYSVPDNENWKVFLKKVDSSTPPAKKDKAHRKISEQEIKSRFQEMASSGKGFKFRTSQVEYAHHVTRALNDSAILCVEAGTGTGKTQGYLIPVMEFLWRNTGSRVAISTYTKSLQDQIFQREIGFSKEIFKIYEDIPVALLKGKSSYVCAEKLDDSYERGLRGDKLLAWLYLLNNVYNYKNADADVIGENVWKYLNGQNIMVHTLNTVSAKEGCDSRHFRCPAQVVTAKARNSRLIVTNHHKLALLNREPILSGLYRNYIIDEANHFEDAVRSVFRTEANSSEIHQSLLYLEKTIRKIQSKGAGVKKNALKDSLKGIETLTTNINELRSILASISPRLKFMKETVLIPNHSNFREGHINTHLQAMRDAISSIYSGVETILDGDSRLLLKIVSRTTRKLQLEINLLKGFSESLKQIEDSLKSQNSVPSYILLKKNIVLFASPVEVDEIIRKNIYEDRDSIVYTAATLCHNRSFNCFHGITGLSEPFTIEGENNSAKRIESVDIPSPFSSNLVELIVPKGAISGRYDNKEAWLNKIVPMIADLIKDNKGRTLVLFSSYEDLKHVAEKISEDITNSGYPLLIQKPGSPTINLCDEFRTVKESVLLGVDSFWYGVDFMGDTLTQVVITRVPYPSPKDPIQMARKTILPAEEYWQRLYYEKDIKLKQGIGRLIRSETDKGKVIILDSRFKAKDYSIREKFYPVMPEDKDRVVTNDDGYDFSGIAVRPQGVAEQSQIFPDNDLDINRISNLKSENIAVHHDVKDSVSNNYSDYLSTTALAKEYGINPKTLYDYFVEIGWTEKKGTDRKLTELGKENGGKYKTLNKKDFWIVWPTDILKDDIFQKLIFKNTTEQAGDRYDSSDNTKIEYDFNTPRTDTKSTNAFIHDKIRELASLLKVYSYYSGDARFNKYARDIAPIILNLTKHEVFEIIETFISKINEIKKTEIINLLNNDFGEINEIADKVGVDPTIICALETYSTIKKYKDDTHTEHETDESNIGNWSLKKTNDKFSDQRIIEIRKKYRRAYEPWSDREDNLLRQKFKETKSIKHLSETFQRNPGAKLEGSWESGWAIDLHTLKSAFLGDGHFDTTYTDTGYYLNRLKYHQDYSQIPVLSDIAISFLRSRKATPYIDVIIPVLPSVSRKIQPVEAIAKIISKSLSMPFDNEYLLKLHDTSQLKNVVDQSERKSILEGVFDVNDLRYKDKKVLLFDDLFRSGSTLNEITRILYNKGKVQTVYVLTLTKTRAKR